MPPYIFGRTNVASALRKMNHVTLDTVNFRTQKARGIHYLLYMSQLGGRQVLLVDPLVASAYKETTWHQVQSEFNKPFVRPCPVKPRHGFVDSRVITTHQEWRDILYETKEADPLGELIVMEWIEANASAVVSKHQVAMGSGHDGVTGDKGLTMVTSIPEDVTWKAFRNYDFSRAGVPSKHRPLVELVRCGARSWVPVQIRGVDAGKYHQWATNYASRFSEVKDYELVDLRNHSPAIVEGWIEGHADDNREKVVVIVHSLMSHAGCLLQEAKFTVVDTSFMKGRPSNKTMQFKKTKGPTVRRVKEIAKWMHHGLHMDSGQWDQELLAALASNAAKSYLSDSVDVRVQGIGATMLFQLSAIACIGEFRYWWHQEQSDQKLVRINPFERKPMQGTISHSFRQLLYAVRRDTIYEQGFRMPLFKLLSMTNCAQGVFNNGMWEGNAVGGPRWGLIAEKTLGFYRAMRTFILNPTVKNYKAQGFIGNSLSMLVHNGGTGPLTKFGSVNRMDLYEFLDEMLGLPDKPVTTRGLPQVKNTHDAWTGQKVSMGFGGLHTIKGKTFNGFWKINRGSAATYVPEFLPNHYTNLNGSFGLYCTERFNVVVITASKGVYHGSQIYFDRQGHVHLKDSQGETCAVVVSKGFVAVQTPLHPHDLMDINASGTPLRELADMEDGNLLQYTRELGGIPHDEDEEE